MRDEDPHSVQHCFHWDILSYITQEDIGEGRLLDFGSGCGSSSMVLARMFPKAKIAGVELLPEFVELAKHRAEFHGVQDQVSFSISPKSNSMLENIGNFDCIIFSAVYEHLLPSERKIILPLLWSHLKEGGILFLNQTLYRWFPMERIRLVCHLLIIFLTVWRFFVPADIQNG